MQQSDIALPTTSSPDASRPSAIRKLAPLDTAWLAAQLDAGWVVVLLCYCAVFGGILLYSNFLPYTFDNNESFSAFWHARNMYEYGIANSSGLADESFSYAAAAHPYVYTHAGASPRLFAYLLYVLGIRTIELQIAVTVFTVGVLAFWFAYRFLAEISTRLYATIACLLLMTDYIMFTQWHVGAWHVWKMFLLFGGLYLAQRVAARRQAYPLLIVYAFHAFLFYYETIFNVYVAAAVFLYFVFATRDYRFAFKFGLAQFAGALTAAAVLVSQLVLQLGWDVVRTDIYYTFVGRNFTTDFEAFSTAAKAFYADHNIVFWLNFPDSGVYRNLLWAFRVLFQDHAVHTPLWSLVVLAFAGAEVVRRLRRTRPLGPETAKSSTRAFARRRKLFAKVDWTLLGKDATVLAPFFLAALSATIFYILASHPEIGAGLAPRPSLWIELCIVVIEIAVVAAVIIMLGYSEQARTFLGLDKFLDRVDWDRVNKDATVVAPFILLLVAAAMVYMLISRFEVLIALAQLLLIVIAILCAGAIAFVWPTLFPHPRRILAASLFLAAILVLLLMQPSLYATISALTPVWHAALTELGGYSAGAALLVAGLLLLAASYAAGALDSVGGGSVAEKGPDRLLLALAALLLAYLLVYFVFTGYVVTGYHARYLSLTVFFNDLFLALGLVAMIDCVRGCYARFKDSIDRPRMAYGGAAAVAAVGLAGTVAYWAGLQTFLLRRLPPDEISFFPILAKPPFRDGTFSAFAYGGVVAYFTKNWAYPDGYSALAEGKVTLGPDGYTVKHESPYVWFADRAVNSAYDKPAFFMTMIYQTLSPAYLLNSEAFPRPRAGDVPLVRATREGRTAYLHPVEVARDPSPLDRWSIMRLDWDFPPFLRPLQGADFVKLDALPVVDGTQIGVDYRYAHQEGVPEAGTHVTLLTQSRCTGAVMVYPLPAGTRDFVLPRSFAGTVHAEVQPATATKGGPIYRSGPLTVGSAGACQ